MTTPILHPVAGVYLDLALIPGGPKWTVTPDRLRDVRRAADGTLRETVLYSGAADLPLYTTKHTFAVDYSNISEAAATIIDRALCVPGSHTLALWQHVHVAYRADGTRSEWRLPWLLAADWISPLPLGRPATTFEPVVTLDAAAALDVLVVDTATFDAETPATGEVFFEQQGDRFKLEEAPPAGVIVRVAAVPLFEVIEHKPSPNRHDRVGVLPRQIVLVER